MSVGWVFFGFQMECHDFQFLLQVLQPRLQPESGCRSVANGATLVLISFRPRTQLAPGTKAFHFSPHPLSPIIVTSYIK